MPLTSINPASGQVIRTYPEMGKEQIFSCVELTQQSFIRWKKISFRERGLRFKRMAQILRKEKETLATLAAMEMGKPISQGRTEVEKCAWCCEYYAKNGQRFLRDEIVKTSAKKSLISFQPLGVILAIMPWNFPFWQVFRFAVPALMAGNAVVVKHAPHVTGCALALERIFAKAGFPANLLKTLLIASAHVDEWTAALIERREIKAVTLTGSTRAGRAIAEKAGRSIKKCVLELGGSDPYILLKDADLEKSIDLCVSSRLSNSGQSCIAAKRFIVPRSLQKRVIEMVVKKMAQRKMGDPLQEDTEIGPLARYDLRDHLHEQVQKSVALGASLHLGGFIPSMAGAFYPATVLSQVKKGMPAYDEELFGPVAVIIEVENEKEAIEVANDTHYGLGAAVFSRNVKKAQRIAREELQAGSAFVNAVVQSDPRLPFGGIKDSGYGRELGVFGIREFVNIKTVSIGR